MGFETCSKCNVRSFFYNVDGVTKEMPCPKCNATVRVEFHSVKTLPTIVVKCMTCGTKHEFGYAVGKTYCFKGSRARKESTNVFSHTPTTLTGPTNCDKCGESLTAAIKRARDKEDI